MPSNSLLASTAQEDETSGLGQAQIWRSSLGHSIGDKAKGRAEALVNGSYFVSLSPEMVRVRTKVEKIAGFDIPVLILGETGTGKDLVARLIHGRSSRARRRFLKVNCAALPEALLESELFGHERGAFTGAFRSKPGQFEMCNGGTIFLDEVAEMPPALQAKLLHVLQDKCFYRLGGDETIHVDVRILAATNVNIGEAISSRTLREDLYYRLNAFTIQLPPLRSRTDEIPFLLEHFIGRFASDHGCATIPLSRRLVDACVNYHWPGNIRELQSFVHRLLIQEDEEQSIRELQACAPAIEERPSDLKALGREVKGYAERFAIAQAFQEAHYNRRVTAERLKISYRALCYKLRQYGLD
jgi:two-component system, NtrC family, response regulator AtoC